MSMTDKEIALELTKSYFEHLNARVNIRASHSHADVKTLGETYRHIYKVVSQADQPKE